MIGPSGHFAIGPNPASNPSHLDRDGACGTLRAPYLLPNFDIAVMPELIHNDRVARRPEVPSLAENQPSSFSDSIGNARQRLELELRALAGQIQKLQYELTELQQVHERTAQEASRQWDEIARTAELSAAEFAEQKAVMVSVLVAVRGLMTCTIPDQVFQTLTEEAAQWGVRAAIFDVRGSAAWGASAHGFGPGLSEKDFRSLIIQLRQDNPFHQVCETAGHVEASAETLKRNRNVLEKLKPAPHAPILLLPIRSAGTVTAIFYADPGEGGASLPTDALMILAEFAGAQIDRLIALSGGFADEEVEEEVEPDRENESPGETSTEVATGEPAPAEPRIEEPGVEKPAAERTRIEVAAADEHLEVKAAEASLPEAAPPAATSEAAAEPLSSAAVAVETPVHPTYAVEPSPSAGEITLEFSSREETAYSPLPPPVEVAAESSGVVAPVIESEAVPPSAQQEEAVTSPASSTPAAYGTAMDTHASSIPPIPAGFDVTQLSEAEQKVHRDARRFAKLLVSEIELYNKAKVAEGRKSRDLYKRLKTDIDRSRQTFEKRFGKALSNQIDYFHDELVRTLAANDSEALGPDYPGPPE
jgi:hypothetical protein